jgi:hypothetical protein
MALAARTCLTICMMQRSWLPSGGGVTTDLTVNKLGSIAFWGIEGEKVLQREIRLSVWFTSHDDHVPLFPRGLNITTLSERNATFPLRVATCCHMHPFAHHFCSQATTL